MPDVKPKVNAAETYAVQCPTKASGDHYRWCYRNSIVSTDDAAENVGKETYTRTFTDRLDASQFKREFGFK